MKTFRHLWQHLAEFLFESEMFQIQVVEKIKTHNLPSATFFRLWDNVAKRGVARHSADNMAHARCTITCTHSTTRARAHACTEIRGTYCFHTATTFRERTSILRYTSVAYLVVYVVTCMMTPACPYLLFFNDISGFIYGVSGKETARRILWQSFYIDRLLIH